MPAFPMTFPQLLRVLEGGVRVERAASASLSIRGVSTDTRTLAPGELFCALSGPRFCGNDFVGEAFARGASACVVQAGAPVRGGEAGPVIAVESPLYALGQLAAEHRLSLRRPMVVAITGSVGKTSTRELLRQLLEGSGEVVASEASFNNAIGVPLTLLKARAETRYLLCEIGTSQSGEVRALTRLVRPDLGIVTHVAAAHLEGLGTLTGIAYEKSALIRGLKKTTGIAVLNADDPRVYAMRNQGAAAVVTYGERRGATVRGELVAVEDGTRLSVRIRDRKRFTIRLPFPGRHQALNALAALAAAHGLGLRAHEIAHRLEQATLPGRRMESHHVGPFTVIDDSYNANPASTRAALEVLARVRGRRIFVFGGMRELGHEEEALHRELGRSVASSAVDLLVGVGDEAALTCAEAVHRGLDPARVCATRNAEAALQVLDKALRPGDRVLLKGSRAAHLEDVLEGLKARYV